ncbi:MAG: amino acid ABC transporter permease [Rhodospirillales bacterium]|nr:amino acid ABC transporter permease [Rhodospirillales bacterium]
MSPLVNFHLFWTWRWAIAAGAETTLLLGATALVISLAFGVLGWLLKSSRRRALATAGSAYVELFRNTPTLVFLYLCYFGLPEISVRLDAFWYAALALGVQGGAYVAEIIRGAFSAVSPGQRLAARALGLSAWQSLRLVELPQTFAVAFPSLGNQVVATVLGTALASVITVPELTYRLQVIGDSTYQYFSVFAAAALVYIVLVQLLNQLFQELDRRRFRMWRGRL